MWLLSRDLEAVDPESVRLQEFIQEFIDVENDDHAAGHRGARS